MLVIGIDPGQKGGMALIQDGKLIDYKAMPAEKRLASWFYDIWSKVSNEGAIVPKAILEKAQAMPKQGVTGMFNYGNGYGFIRGLCTAYGFDVHEVRPAAWKLEMGLTSNKDDSVAMCTRLFPDVNLYASKRCRVEHDGMAEAILLGEYGWRMRKLL